MQVTGRRDRSCAADGKPIVLGEVARLLAVLTERGGNSGNGVFGNVFVQRARLRSRRQDALNCLVLVRTIQSRVCECRIEVSGIVALTE